MTKKRVVLWVSPKFHRSFKTISSEKGISMYDYSDQLADKISGDNFWQGEKKKKKTGGKYFDSLF